MDWETDKQNIRSFLALHRHAQALLTLKLPVHTLIDPDFCSVLSSKLAESECRWNIKVATPQLGELIERRKGLYMFVWRPCLSFSLANPELAFKFCFPLYVGRAIETNTIRARYCSEYSKYVHGKLELLWDRSDPKTREERLKRHLALRPLEFWYMYHDDDNRIRFLEDKLIEILGPPANKVGVISAKSEKPQPIWRSLNG